MLLRMSSGSATLGRGTIDAHQGRQPRSGMRPGRAARTPPRTTGRASPRDPSSSSPTSFFSADADPAAAAYEGEDFYSILGVSPAADAGDIKRAYRGIMRECHPDLSCDDESAEFCVLLNEVYETLSDPQQRELYDSLAGFATSSVNPFLDASGSFPADRVFVDEYTCIGCRNCTNVACKTFAMEEEYGRARAMRQGVDTDEQLQTAIDSCPVNCIYWVTAPQQSLLEAAMARMERVQVWALMSGGGSGRDVFTEASLAWEKRQAGVRARAEARTQAAAAASWWGGAAAAAEPAWGARMYSQQRAAGSASSSDDGGQGGGEEEAAAGAGTEGGGREGGRIANLAARAARASRSWRWMQGVRQQRSRRELVAATSGARGGGDGGGGE